MVRSVRHSPPLIDLGQRTSRLLAHGLRVTAAVWAALALVACERPSGGARVEGVSPAPLRTGESLVIHGRGFGAAPAPGDQIGLDGRALSVIEWGPESLRARVPADQRAGEVFLVIRAQGEALSPFGVRVGGETQPSVEPPPEWPQADATITRDAQGPPEDARLPDATLEGARAEFIPDPDEGPGAHLFARPSPAGEILLEVVADTGAWGAAFHLVWDPNLLTLVSAAPASGLAAERPIVWRTLEPGRLAFGGRLPMDGTPILSLRFALIGTGEGRIEVPTRFASVRSAANVPLGPGEWRWHGATIRSRVVLP